jgi:ribose 5-phosphate isomerase B
MQTKVTQIYIGSDHAGYEMKEAVKKYIAEKPDFKVVDLGAFSQDSIDYPDIAREVCEKIVDEKGALGILICGTGIGMMMSANKRAGIRAAVCTVELMAKMARLHNDANVLCLGSRVIGADLAKSIVDTFLTTKFENDERHVRRIGKMEANAQPQDPNESC